MAESVRMATKTGGCSQEDWSGATEGGLMTDEVAVNRLLAAAVDRWDTDLLVQRIEQGRSENALLMDLRDDTLRGLARSSFAANLSLAKQWVAGNEELPAEEFEPVIQWAQTMADIGVSRQALLDLVREGTLTAWSDLNATIEQTVSEATESAEEQRLALVRGFGRVLAFNNRLQTIVDQSYQAQEEVHRRSGAQARHEAVRRVLGTADEVSSTDLYPVLQYELALHHVAVLVSGVAELAAQKLVTRLRSEIAASGSLLIRERASEFAMWFSSLSPWSPAALKGIVDELSGSGFRAYVSSSGKGVTGFRETYVQLTRIGSVQNQFADPPAVLQYADVRLEALILDNPAEAARFVRSELGRLADDSASAERLRSTLGAWYETGSYVRAAALLHLHEHTVRNRLQRIEEILGRPVDDRRLELHMALRLRQVTGAPRVRGG
jgi:hypothetical protein